MTTPLQPDWTPDQVLLKEVHRWLEGHEPVWVRLAPLLGLLLLGGAALWAVSITVTLPITGSVSVIEVRESAPVTGEHQTILDLLGSLPRGAAGWAGAGVVLRLFDSQKGRRRRIHGTLMELLPAANGLWRCRMAVAPESVADAALIGRQGSLDGPGSRRSLAALVWQRIRLPERTAP